MPFPLPTFRTFSIVLLSLVFSIGCKKNDPAPPPPIPAISGVSPSTDTIGAQVIIKGSNFSAAAAGNLVKFNGVTAAVTAATATQLIVTVPAGATTGPLTVTVNGQTGTSASPFTVLGPAITGFLPSIIGIRYPVIIKGSIFNANPAMNSVTINGIPAAVLAAADSQLTVMVPENASSGKVVVKIKEQTIVSLNDLVIKKATVITMAGTGNVGHVNGPAKTATFFSFWAVIADQSGNLYITDAGNNQIRKITPDGIVSTVAGTWNMTGYTDGPVSIATFLTPSGVAVDKTGNIYVSDMGYHNIRKIDGNGIVTTIAGNPISGWADGTGSAAHFDEPLGLAVDASNNIYVADGNNNMIRKISPTGVVTTFAGGGLTGSADGQGMFASFDRPSMIVLDSVGNLYVTDVKSNKIRKITPGGYVSTFAGSGVAGETDGQGTAASFNWPIGITIDAKGNLYVTEQVGSRLRMITPGGLVTTLAGHDATVSIDGIGADAELSAPLGITIDKNGVLYILDSWTNEVRKVTIQ